MESLFHALKAEWICGRVFTPLGDLEVALHVYINFYNRHYLRSGIDYHTPEEYERLAV